MIHLIGPNLSVFY